MRVIDFTAIIALFGALGVEPANALPTTAAFDNAEALAIDAVTTNEMLLERFGVPSSEDLTLSGSFSDSGYAFSLDGAFGAMPVSLAFTGAFDAVSGDESFSGSGAIDAGGFSEAGLYSIVNSGPYDGAVTGGEAAAILAKDTDIENLKITISCTDLGSFLLCVDTATGIKTPSGEPYMGSSRFTVPKTPGQKGAFDEGATNSYLNGVIDYDAGTVSGVMTTVPEPAPWATMLLGLGGLGAAIRGSRRKALIPTRLQRRRLAGMLQ